MGTLLFVCIPWDHCTEYFEISTSNLPQAGSQLQTREYWHEEQELADYIVHCRSAELEGDSFKMTLSYLATSNPDLARKCEAWGESTIRLNLRAHSGTASWKDTTDKARNGTVTCRVQSNALFESVTHRETQITARPGQGLTRQILLNVYGRCALTGEETPAVLDVAHINAATDGGKASMANCILLRTDIHRLWDSKLLSIDPAGKVSLKPEASERYHDELRGAALKPQVLKHVREALERVSYSSRS